MDFYFVQCVITSYYYYLLAPSCWFLCLFDMFPSFFEHFLTFWCNMMFQAHLSFPCHSPGISYFFRVLVPFRRERNLETMILVLIDIGMSLLLVLLSRLGNMYVHTHSITYIHTSISISQSSIIYLR